MQAGRVHQPSTRPAPVRLVRRHHRPLPALLDEAQRAVVERPAGSGPVVVLGAPGTGKSATLIETVVARVQSGQPASRCLVLAPTRSAAASLRDRITERLGRALTEPIARTPASYAYAVLRRDALHRGRPVPVLISGPEQDAILADLLKGHSLGEGRPPDWPDNMRRALALRGFRDELRELLMRAMELGLSPDDLARLGQEHDQAAWVAAAGVFEEYLQVTALAAPGGFDPAALLDQAVALLQASPEAKSFEQERWSLVAVDDLQEGGAALARMLQCIRPPGADLVLTGDPDVSTQGYRGAQPYLVGRAGHVFPKRDGRPADMHTLRTRWRTPPALLPVLQAVVAGVGAAGLDGAHRRAASPAHGGDESCARDDLPARGGANPQTTGRLLTSLSSSLSRQHAWLTDLLRREHLAGARPWADMAVIARTGAALSAVQQVCNSAGIPTSSAVAAVPIRDEPAVRPLRLAMRAACDPSWLTAEATAELLTGVLGGADALALRRLRRWLSVAYPDRPTRRSIQAIVLDPALLATAPAAVAATVSRLTTVLMAARAAADEPGATAETVLWAVWETADLALSWQRAALRGGDAGRRADRDLDAVMALFEAAGRFVDRMPAASPVAFLDLMEAQDVPEDTLADRAPTLESVALLTPASSTGRHWPLVAVLGLQEGQWPDLRLRGSMLGSTMLVDATTDGLAAATGAQERIRAMRSAVLHDERRLLYVAVSRASEVLAVGAVASEEDQPSPFFELIQTFAPAPDVAGSQPPDAISPPSELTLSGVVAQLRRRLVAEQPTGLNQPTGLRASGAEQELARLARAGARGAHPGSWYGVPDLTAAGPLAPEGLVRVSPSAVETFRTCPLRWLLSTHGGQGPPSNRQLLGNLVHEVAHDVSAGSAQEMEAARHSRFAALGIPPGWIADREEARSRTMVAKLADYCAQQTRELVATEADFALTVGSALLRGRVDRVERDEHGRLVVVDLKTGAAQPTGAELSQHPQLATYQVAVAEGAFAEFAPAAITAQASQDAAVAESHNAASGEPQWERSGGAALVQLGGSHKAPAVQWQPPLSDSEDPTWAHRMVAEVAQGMRGPVFPAVRGDHCRHCPVRASCPAQAEGRMVGVTG